MSLSKLSLFLCLSLSQNLYANLLEFNIEGFQEGKKRYLTYVTKSLLPNNVGAFSFENNKLIISCEFISNELCLSLKETIDPSGRLNYSKYIHNWKNHYLQTRENRQNHLIILNNLSLFAEFSQYKTWPNETILSQIKKQNRRIYRGMINNRKISVAETLDSYNQIREVEIALERHNEINSYEFYVYGIDGEPQLHSEFPNGNRPAPISCAACHMNQAGQANRFID